MAREKKITVRATLNKEIAAKYEDVTKGPMYPIYVDINYDRKYTKFPYGNRYYSTEEYEELMHDDSFFQSHLNTIERMVRFEAERNPSFTLKGFGKKVKSYFSSFKKAGYLAAAHFAFNRFDGKIPSKEHQALRDRSAVKQIEFGLQNLRGKELERLKIMVGNAQLAGVIWKDGLILTWSKIAD
jgi:hypothetical protein